MKSQTELIDNAKICAVVSIIGSCELYTLRRKLDKSFLFDYWGRFNAGKELINLILKLNGQLDGLPQDY